MILKNNLSSLNAQQLEAVTTTEGAVLVVAGAGTGKTKVLTSRIAHIIISGLCTIDEILAVTFTNKAAREMSQRAMDLLSGYNIENIRNPWIGTFHSLALRIIRPLHDQFYRSANFSILDTDDQLRIIRQILKELQISDIKYSPKNIADGISRSKEQDQSADQILATARRFSFTEVLGKVYREYQKRLVELDAIDFSDILQYSIKIFQKNENVLNYYQHKFKYILVDEYQDTNASQYIWLKLLAGKHGNICCVGDDDQSIYSWRGADLDNILQFDKDFENAKIIRLEQNYRSTQNILKAAGALIAENEKRIPKRFTTAEALGVPIKVKALADPTEEASYIARIISEKVGQGEKYGNMAILVRAASQTRILEEKLLSRGIPYILIGGIKFYERKEIKDAIAYIRLIVNRNDNISFERIINVPKRGIGATTMKMIHETSQNSNMSLYQAAQSLNVALDLFRLFDIWSDDLYKLSPEKLMEKVLEESGYYNMLKSINNLENEARLDNLKELLVAMHQFDNITEFLDYTSLVLDNIDTVTQDSVTISTIHGAKGLEYSTVFIPGFEENIMPHQKSMHNSQELEEERRLCYVALTRARKEVYITLSNRRQLFGHFDYTSPSRFLYSLPKECLKML